ncbi:MAG: DUF3572 domain-containing protein [Novosphingobium sp.]
MASRPSATGSTANPLARSRSQNSLRLRSLSSTTRILFVTEKPFPICTRTDPYCPRKALTIIRDRQPAPDARSDAGAIALRALGWILADTERAARFLGLTGLTPDSLRQGLGDPAVLGAVIDFLANHEADLVNAAFALDMSPETIIAARKELS